MPLAIPSTGPVHFAEAIDFFRGKVRIPTRRWNDLWRDQHAVGFMVAGAMRDELLADLQGAVDAAIADGESLDQFRSRFDDIVARHGWSYNGGRNWRTRVIFETNLRTAYSAGRWQQAQRMKRFRPYLRYVAVLDERTRQQHRHWHDTVLPIDHPWWNTHIPPNGWGCRCSLVSLSERDLRRFGLKVSKTPEIERTLRKVRGPKGEEIDLEVPKGIDPGFDYNPGLGAVGRGRQGRKMAARGEITHLWSPGERPAVENLEPATPIGTILPPLTESREADLRRRLAQALGGDEAILSDPLGSPVAVSQAIVDHMLGDPRRLDGRDRYFGLIPELVTQPQEIWVGFVRDETGRVFVRRRHIRLVRVGRKTTVGLVADAEGGDWVAMTFFRGSVSAINGLRQGRRIYPD